MKNDAAYYGLAMRIFVDFSGTIAIPAVLAALLGKWLDQKFTMNGPVFLLILLFLAFLSTALTLKQKAKVYAKKYEAIITSEETIKRR